MSESTVIIRRPPVAPMQRIVRGAVILVTIVMVLASSFWAAMGSRDIAVVYALAAPLGVSAWAFARAGHHQAAVVLLCGVMVAAISATLYLSKLGIHDHAVIAYAGVLLAGALLLSRRNFIVLTIGTLSVASLVFILEFQGLTQSKLGALTGWPALVDFLLIMGVVAALGRWVAEILFGSLGDAQQSSVKDAATGLNNRARFLSTMASRMRSADPESFGVLALADIENFRRVNHVIGHASADRILAEVGRRAGTVSPGALVGRIGDDEFALFALDLLNSDEARDLARQLEQTLSFDHLGVSVKVAVGFAVFPRDANGAEALWMAADSSLAQVKGRTSVADKRG